MDKEDQTHQPKHHDPKTQLTLIRVRYSETDAMGLAYHGRYLEWLEIGRTEWLRARGMIYRDLEAQNLFLPVISVSIDYHRPIVYDDVISISCSLFSYRGARLSFSYEIFNNKQKILTKASTSHALISKNFKPCRAPSTLHNILTTGMIEC